MTRITASFRSGPGSTIAKAHTAQILLHMKLLRNVKGRGGASESKGEAKSKLARMNRHGSQRTDLQINLKGSG